jgi:hypothetical protein
MPKMHQDTVVKFNPKLKFKEKGCWMNLDLPDEKKFCKIKDMPLSLQTLKMKR